MVSDRLAITVNLCGYTRRLNASSLGSLGYNYSTFTLSLVLFNGIIAPFWTTRIFLGGAGGQLLPYSWRSEHITGFLYLPAFFGGWSNPEGNEPRLADIKVRS